MTHLFLDAISSKTSEANNIRFGFQLLIMKKMIKYFAILVANMSKPQMSIQRAL